MRKFYAMIVKVFTLARVAKLADARDLKSRVPKGTYRFDSGPGHQAENLEIPSSALGISTQPERPSKLATLCRAHERSVQVLFKKSVAVFLLIPGGECDEGPEQPTDEAC